MDEAESLSSLHLTLDVPGNRSQRSPKTCHLATRLRCEARHHDEIRVPDDVAGAEPLDLGRKMETGDKHGQTLRYCQYSYPLRLSTCFTIPTGLARI